ncbi:MAG: ABC transporter ATP-binding protein [Alphaproteobacteria bacterium]|nr:ABC transporter ATP-binding protein [Alphaproteobacteria bacterium]MCW5741966.1 ABC transporter ATP-binding protein [Alphaproteobacteria bacterium]
MSAALDIESLTVGYGGEPVLRDVSLAVEPGRILALLGANGAGKTTLLRAAMGLVPSAGRILVGDRRIDGLSPERRARSGLGYVPEGRRVFPGLTVRENIEVAVVGGAALRGRRIAQMLALFPALAEKARERAWRLSGGQQQMLAIARALASGPPVLLLDEPSLGLAPIVAREVFGRLRIVADGGVAVLLAEQNATRALAIADEAVVLARGGVAHRGPAAGLTPQAVADLLVAG